MRLAKAFSLLFALGALPSLPGANFVFIFHGSASALSIYNADTLELLAPSVTVDAQPVKAFGVPDPDDPRQFLKFYVITPKSVVVLDPQPPFAVRATLALSGDLAAGPDAAVLTPDGQRILVAAGNLIHVINTTEADDVINDEIAPSAAPLGFAVLPNSSFAYVLLQGRSFLQILDLTISPPELLATTISMPAGVIPGAIGAAPNGSRIYAATNGSVLEIDRVSNAPSIAISTAPVGFFSNVSSVSFDPDPPVGSAVLNGGASAAIVNLASRSVTLLPFTAAGGLNIGKIVLPGSGRAFLLAGSPGRVFQAILSAGGAATELIEPQTGVPFAGNALGMEASPDGSRLFVAFTAASRLVRLDTAGVSGPSQVSLLQAPSGLSLVFGPATAASSLEIYGGNNQTAPVNTVFPASLAVRARAGNPAFRQTVSFASTSSGVSFSDPIALTNLAGVAETLVEVSVTTPVQVQATVTSGGTSTPVTFTLNLTGPVPGVLVKVSGDRQLVLQNSAFPAPLVVRGFANAFLTVSTLGPVKCPSFVVADADGLASIACTAEVLSANLGAEIRVSDFSGNTLSEPFRVTVVASASDLPTRVSVSEREIAGRARVTSTIEARALKPDGSPSSLGAGIFFTTPQDATFNPNPAVTLLGVATTAVTFGCFLGRGTIVATLQAPGLPSAVIPFNTTAGPVDQVLKRQGDNQTGNPGQLLDRQALRVQVTDACNNPISGVAVTWVVSPSDAATLESRFVRDQTDSEGNSSVLVRMGERPGSFVVAATVVTASGPRSAVFNLTVVAIPSRLLLVSGNNQNVVVGQATAEPLVVAVRDDRGNNVAAAGVTFTVRSGSATLGSPRATADAQGRASTTVRAGNTVGRVTIVAGVSGVGETVTFTITVVGRVPVVSTTGFVEAAEFRVGWVPGGLGSITGLGLMEGVTGVVQADQFPWPTAFRGVRVIVEGINAPIISLANFQSREQINIQVPFNLLAPGTVNVVIENNGSQATFSGVRTVALNPGILEFGSGRTRLAAAQRADGSVVSASNPARKGEIIFLFLTGMGGINPPVGTNVPGPLPPAETLARPAVIINNDAAEVLGSFYAPGFVGLYQINFRIPQSASSGLARISVVADGASSQELRIPIQ